MMPITKRPRAKESEIEATLALHLKAYGLDNGLEREFVFAPPRKWRFDFAWPDYKFAVEVEGVIGGAGGRHQRRDGYAADCEKYNQAVIEGWVVMRFTGSMVRDGSAVGDIGRALEIVRST